MSNERLDRIESDVRHLRTALQGLMFEVRRSAKEIAEIKRRSTDQEWEERLASLHQPQADRLDDGLKLLHEQAAEVRCQGEETSAKDGA